MPTDVKKSDLPQPRLIPHVISDRARNAPQSIWASIPVSSLEASKGYEDVTFARLNYAITRTCRWLQETIQDEPSTGSHRTLAYMGPPDSRYIILTVAAIKTGFTMLFLSPRNSDEAQESVIEQAKSTIFLSPLSMEGRVQKLLHSRSALSSMTHYIVPEQHDLLTNEPVPDFPYDRSVGEARLEPLVVLHTSSTTGIPKTIPLNQGYGMHEDIVQHVPDFQGLDIITRKPFYGACRMFVAMPLYHAGGVLLTLLKSLYHDIVSVFQPSSAALDAEVFDSILRYGRCSGCVIPPYLLEEMLAEAQYFETLANLDFVQFGSGPLSHSAGKQLLTRQKNCPHFMGSSECGLYILLELGDPVTDWQYFRFHPWSGVDMRPIDTTGQTFELVVVKSSEPSVPGLQPVFELFPDLDEWQTHDLYVQHPSKPDHWRCIGRNDDVLVLSNGEKLNPVDTESRIAGAHPAVTGVLVIGHGQFAPGLLLEVRGSNTSDPADRSRLIEEIWPLIQNANHDAPGHGRLDKELILIGSSQKPFLRTPKLSVRRKPTIDLYAEQIAEMYERYMKGHGDEADPSGLRFDLGSRSTIQAGLSEFIRAENGWDDDLDPEEDLFMRGIDSLQVLRLGRRIKAALSQHGRSDGFDTRMLYRNPTLTGLSQAIFDKVQATSGSDLGAEPIPRNSSLIKTLIEKHSQFDDIPDAALNGPNVTSKGVERQIQRDEKLNIILTGSTGSLGSHILLALLAKPSVANVYCINRSEDAEPRQLSLFKEHGIDLTQIKAFESRVHFLHSPSLAAPQLGLTDPGAFELLRDSKITHIVHNAWPVNFNIGLVSFEKHIAGVRALIDFCRAFAEPPKILFVSSLSSITTLSTKELVPEAIVHDSLAPSPMGYGESKYIAEHLLNKATEATHGWLSTAILRVGQIAGPTERSKATWPVREWLPSLVVSSNTVHALPETLGRMDTIEWLPVDLLAEGVCDLLESQQAWGTNSQQAASSVFHVVNPSTTTWANIIAPLKAQLDNVQMVPLEDWIELIRQGPDEDSRTRNPAKKILPFYESLLFGKNSSDEATNDRERFAKGNMGLCSETFRQMPPISGEMLAQWAPQWF